MKTKLLLLFTILLFPLTGRPADNSIAGAKYTPGNGNQIPYRTTDDGSGNQSLHVVVDSGGGGAVTVADGANVTQGAKADAKSTATDTTPISIVSILKQISASVQAPPSQAVTGPLTDTQLRAAAVPTSDAGSAFTDLNGVAGARFTSADQSGAVASVSDAPTSGQKLVITDCVISVDTAMRVDFSVESSATVIETVYMAANSTVNLVTRAKWKLPTVNKKLQIQTSVAGNISVNPRYHSEP